MLEVWALNWWFHSFSGSTEDYEHAHTIHECKYNLVAPRTILIGATHQVHIYIDKFITVHACSKEKKNGRGREGREGRGGMGEREDIGSEIVDSHLISFHDGLYQWILFVSVHKLFPMFMYHRCLHEDWSPLVNEMLILRSVPYRDKQRVTVLVCFGCVCVRVRFATLYNQWQVVCVL